MLCTSPRTIWRNRIGNYATIFRTKVIYRRYFAVFWTCVGLVCFQILRAMSDNELAEKKLRNNVWLTDIDDKQSASSRFARNYQYEVPSDVVMKNASPYPKITRRGFAGEEFFLKASKSVPRIGRRNNEFAEQPKRSVNSKVRTLVGYEIT